MILGNEIGRGGFGTVYELSDDKSKVVKVSNKNSNMNCRKWSDEFAKINSICSYKLPKLDYVEILKPDSFEEKNGLCYMISPRIFRHDYSSSKSSSKSSSLDIKNKPTIHPLLGQDKGTMIFKGRGEFIGCKEVIEILGSSYDISKICYELGVMMASIHFVSKNDAYDIEIFMGKKYRNRKICFYIADFDLSEPLPDDIDDNIIERLKWSIEAVPYFPNEFVDELYYNQFKKGYYSVISKYDKYIHLFNDIFTQSS